MRNNCNMHFSQKMRSLVVIAFFACIALTLAQDKESVCCREVSSKEITVPITGFRLQPERLPCVKAVIFYTSEGAKCSHWRESWVKAKVTELRKLQAREKSKMMNTTTITPKTAGSTQNSKTN